MAVRSRGKIHTPCMPSRLKYVRRGIVRLLNTLLSTIIFCELVLDRALCMESNMEIFMTTEN